MNDKTERQEAQQELQQPVELLEHDDHLEHDEQFPGSYFRIPAPPRPGQTTWRLT